MAEKPESPGVAPDLYDLGDTGLFPATVPASSSNGEAQPSANLAAPAADVTPSGDRPRNPDGTFAPVTTSGNHPVDLRQDAEDHGFSEDEIAGMTTPALRSVLGARKRNVAQQRERERSQWRSQQELDRLLKPTGSPGEPRTQPAPATPPAESDFDLGLDEGQFDPALVAALGKITKHFTAEIAALKQGVGAVVERDVQRTVSANTEKIDAAFAGLPEKYQKLFGTKAASEMSESDRPAMKRRLAVLTEAGVDPKGVVGRIGPKVKEAADTLYGPLLEAAAPAAPAAPAAKPGIDPKEWAQAGLARPTQRSGAPEPKGEELAKRNLRAKFGEDAQGEDAADAGVLDGLLN